MGCGSKELQGLSVIWQSGWFLPNKTMSSTWAQGHQGCDAMDVQGVMALMVSQWLPSQSVSSALGCPAENLPCGAARSICALVEHCLLGLQKPEHLEATSLHSFQSRCGIPTALTFPRQLCKSVKSTVLLGCMLFHVT